MRIVLPERSLARQILGKFPGKVLKFTRVYASLPRGLGLNFLFL
jgi:hypothetical protein